MGYYDYTNPYPFWNTMFKGVAMAAEEQNLNLGANYANVQIFAGQIPTVPTVVVHQNGNVGIGTTAPGFKLDVQGGQINASSGLCMNGDCKANWAAVGGGGGGTVTSVAAGTGLTALPSPITTTGTLSFDTTFGDGRYVPKAGGTMTGALNLPANGLVVGTNQLVVSGGNVTANGSVTGSQLVSNVVTGTSPLAVSSTTQVANLNASLLGGTAASALRTRVITYLGGCDTCSALADADSQHMIYKDLIGPMTITSVTCYSDAGTPNINIALNAGNILGSFLQCTTAGAINSSPSPSAMSLNDKLDFVMVTAGGTAKRVTVSIVATLN